MPAKLITSPSAERGFTLVEVLMAMLILTVGLLGLLQSIQVAYQHNARNKIREEAVLLAEEQMNNFKTSTAFHPVTTVTRVIGGVDKRYTVTKESQPIGGDTKRLTVAVHWSFKNLTAVHEIYTLKKM